MMKIACNPCVGSVGVYTCIERGVGHYKGALLDHTVLECALLSISQVKVSTNEIEQSMMNVHYR